MFGRTFYSKKLYKSKKKLSFCIFRYNHSKFAAENPLLFNSQTGSGFYQQTNIPKNQNLRK
jgi:hypothetical protein